jgi:phytoene dehydrogenase-like protein
MAERFDAVVIGGGHNGLVAASYLAKAGDRVLVLERRDVLGGAAVSEHPFGPDYTVTSLSYVVSLLEPRVVADLELRRHGYLVYPQGPYFAPHADGTALRLFDDPTARHREIAKFSKRDADAYDAYQAHLDRLGVLVAPLLTRIPPKLGSRRPRDLAQQLQLLTSLRQVDEHVAVALTRLLTSSIADLVEDHFESDAMRGVLSVSGVIGTWAGPRAAGTAYVMLHHHLGAATEGASTGSWGFARGGMGAVSEALGSAARAAGASIRTEAPVARIRTANDTVVGVTLADGTEIDADVVVATAHPAITFLELIDPVSLPQTFLDEIRRWKSRSGTVKINLALDRLPVFSASPEFDPELHGGTIVLADSLTEIEHAFQQAVASIPADRPLADICIPSVFDDSLAPEGHHVMSMFTEWVPHEYAAAPKRAELDRYADRVMARMEEVAPGFTSSVLHRQVIGPYDMEHEYGLVGGNIFHGELSLGQMFHARPAAGYADLRTPISGLYQAGSATHGGGGVTGIPGYNVVRQIAADRRRAERRPRRLLARAQIRSSSRPSNSGAIS